MASRYQDRPLRVPKLRVRMPGVANPRSITPTLKLQIPIADGLQSISSQSRSDSPPLEYYRPVGPSYDLGRETSTEATIRPPRFETTTKSPLDDLGDIRKTLNEIETRILSVTSDPSIDATTKLLNSPQWSDDILEEIDQLGEGAGGVVHKVRDKRTNRIMARKTITSEAPMKQLLREISIISSTTHENIILFHGAYISPLSSEVKVLMGFCRGGSLEAVGKRIKERRARVGEKVAGRLAEGVLQGLNCLHSKKIIHRDIKPSNILLSSDGIVKLCDFGVSGELVDSVACTPTGTSFYMAPERISGHPYTIRSDVWSTGISLLELVQYRFSFPTDLPPIDLMIYITQAQPPRLDDEEGAQWSDAMKDFIKETLIVDAQTRPTPKDILAHPWIVKNMQEKVNMARWIREVWGWPQAR